MMTPFLLVEFVLTGPGFGRGEAALFILSIPDGEPNQTVHGGAFALRGTFIPIPAAIR
jgi:hypothetical protein